jgi:DnaJ-class molecular chaperone
MSDRKIKPQTCSTDVKCRRCHGKGTVYSQQSFSGVKGGKWSCKSCPRCFGCGWRAEP